MYIQEIKLYKNPDQDQKILQILELLIMVVVTNLYPTAVVTSVDGVGAKIIPYGPEIGRLLNTKKIEPGAGYEASPSPTIKLPSSIVLKDASGNFQAGEVLTGVDKNNTAVTATVVSFIDSILRVKDATGQYAENSTVTGSVTTNTGVVLKNDLATATINVGRSCRY